LSDDFDFAITAVGRAALQRQLGPTIFTSKKGFNPRLHATSSISRRNKNQILW
jgi:hypothetical protein